MFKRLLSTTIKIITSLTPSNKLSVLTYHRVGESYNQLYLDEHVFEQQLIWLKEHYHPLGLSEALALQKAGKLPKRAVAITIDDGYLDSYTSIFPLLKKHQLKATFFISTSGLTQGYLWDEHISSIIMQLPVEQESFSFDGVNYQCATYNQRVESAREIIARIKYCTLVQREDLIAQLVRESQSDIQLPHQFLNEKQIQEMHQHGMEIGAHTVNHPILLCENEQVARQEIANSKAQLEAITQEPVKYLAYPNGKQGVDFDNRTVQITKDCGFEAAFSTDWGCIQPNKANFFALKRFTPWDSSRWKFNIRLALNFVGYYGKLDKNRG